MGGHVSTFGNSGGGPAQSGECPSLATVDVMRIAIIAAVGRATNEVPRLPIKRKPTVSIKHACVLRIPHSPFPQLPRPPSPAPNSPTSHPSLSNPSHPALHNVRMRKAQLQMRQRLPMQRWMLVSHLLLQF